MAALDSLIAGYEADGDTVDATGISGDATASGATFTSPGKIYPQAAFFDKIDDHWDFPALGITQDSDPFSFSVQISFTGVPSTIEHFLVNSSAAGGGGRDNFYNVVFRRNTDGTMYFAIGKTAVWSAALSTNSALLTSADTYYNVVCTYDGSRTTGGMNIYFDDTLPAVTPSGAFGAVANAKDDWRFGRDNIDVLQFGGKANQMLFWDREITAAEVSELYNGGAGLDIFAGAETLHSSMSIYDNNFNAFNKISSKHTIV